MEDTDIFNTISNLKSQGKTNREIELITGWNKNRVAYLLKKYGLSSRDRVASCKNPITYFDTIDTEEKAYILGLLMADGSNNSGDRMILELHESDESMLYTIQKCIGAGTIRNKSTKKPHMKVLNISNTYMMVSLEKMGFVQAKTRVMRLENSLIPIELLRHYYRGFFDGDGHISAKGQSNFPCGSKSFVEDTLSVFSEIDPYNAINVRYIDEACNGKGYYRVTLGKRNFKILEWMYEGSNIYLDRKKKAYEVLKTKWNK